MRIALVNPPNPPRAVSNKDMMGGFGQLYGADCPTKAPISDLLYSAAILEREGFPLKVIDCLAEGFGPERFLETTGSYHPRWVMIRTSTPTWQWDMRMAREVKRKLDCKVVLFGPHVGQFPEESLEDMGVDAVVIGEPEEALAELATKGFERTRGVWFKDSGHLAKNPPRDPIDPLDRLPFPAWNLVPYRNYFFGELARNQTPSLTILGSRGCPYCCGYCPYPLAQGHRWRSRSAESLFAEMQFLKARYEARFLLFRPVQVG